MKTKYITIISILLLSYILIVIRIKPELKYSEWINNAATIGATFAAIIAAVIALSVADKPKRKLQFEVITEKDENSRSKYPACPSLKWIYGQPIDNPLETIRVYFRIKNTSGFTLSKPVITFKLPSELQHPKKDNGKYVRGDNGEIVRAFNSNLFNVQKDFRLFNYDDIIVLSNNVLPFLNDRQQHPVWIRMCRLKSLSGNPWIAIVEMNCDNAEGVTKSLELTFP